MRPIKERKGKKKGNALQSTTIVTNDKITLRKGEKRHTIINWMHVDQKGGGEEKKTGIRAGYLSKCEKQKPREKEFWRGEMKERKRVFPVAQK